jgi:hypothetical protein
MKLKQLIAIALGLGLIPSLASADVLYRLSWRGTVYITGATGQVTAKSFSERDFINAYAAYNGVDPRTLAFVYRPIKHDTALVRVSDGGFVSDVIQMETDYTQVSNTGQTKMVRQAFLADEARGNLGSAFGTESARYDEAGNLLTSSFHGTFQYSIRDTAGTIDLPLWLANLSPPFVFSGTFSTGAKIKDLTGN